MKPCHLIASKGAGSMIVEAALALSGLPFEVEMLPYLEPGPPRDTLPYGPIDDQGRRRSSDNLPLMRAVRRGYRTDRLVMRYRKPDITQGIVSLKLERASS